MVKEAIASASLRDASKLSETFRVLKAACPATWASPLGLAADSVKLESLGRGWEAQMM